MADLQGTPVGPRHTLRPANHSTPSVSGSARFLPVRLPHAKPQSTWSQKNTMAQAQCVASKPKLVSPPSFLANTRHGHWVAESLISRPAGGWPEWGRFIDPTGLAATINRSSPSTVACNWSCASRRAYACAQNLAGSNTMNRSVRRPPWRDQEDHWSASDHAQIIPLTTNCFCNLNFCMMPRFMEFFFFFVFHTWAWGWNLIVRSYNSESKD